MVLCLYDLFSVLQRFFVVTLCRAHVEAAAASGTGSGAAAWRGLALRPRVRGGRARACRWTWRRGGRGGLGVPRVLCVTIARLRRVQAACRVSLVSCVWRVEPHL